MKNAKLYPKKNPKKTHQKHHGIITLPNKSSLMTFPPKKPDDTSLPNSLAYSALVYSVTVRSHFALPAHFLPLSVGAS